MGKKFLIDQELAERIGNYLAQRPWAEVHEMVAGILRLQPAPPPPTVPEPPDAKEGA